MYTHKHTHTHIYHLTHTIPKQKKKPWNRKQTLITMSDIIYAGWASPCQPPTFIKWNKHRNSCCRPLVVTFLYYAFGTLSCATKLKKVPHISTNYCRDWILRQWSTQWLLCNAMKIIYNPYVTGVTIKSYQIIIIHKFSIALFPAERAQRACSHTCT